MPEWGTQCHGLLNMVMISEVFPGLIDSVIPQGSESGMHVLTVLPIL